MRTLLFILGFFFLTSVNARNDESLQIEKDGFIVMVVDFQDGDKIKLFEVETGDHILSKTRGQVDLTFLPLGKYLLENNEGKSVVIERTDEEIVIEELGTEYMVERDSDRMPISEVTVEEELEDIYYRSEVNPLAVSRNGDVFTVLDFEEGDKIKLFEVVDKIHVLTKTTKVVDLTQLSVGKYILENNRGQSVIIEKFDIEMEYTDIVAYN
ncbi:hypothetical protein [Aquimarina litoralis]|uniref:hypothetical protein n=1 Tax=Aquimarina litoralis TaxID=584605 RepID=UPI001C57F185|nr:hypothetical protein [Aquimarina litoralis]MBW1295567.1 hypothetical protein [Aquimarina litoralis]